MNITWVLLFVLYPLSIFVIGFAGFLYGMKYSEDRKHFLKAKKIKDGQVNKE